MYEWSLFPFRLSTIKPADTAEKKLNENDLGPQSARHINIYVYVHIIKDVGHKCLQGSCLLTNTHFM